MPQPVPLTRRLPAHLLPPPARPPETPEARRDRQLDLTRELTDLNMLAARDAAHRIATRDPDADPADTPAAQDPTLALARATRAVTSVINIENRIVAGRQAAPFTIEDPPAVVLRNLLHPLAARETDPARRRALQNHISDRIDDALGADLDDDLPLVEVAIIIANEHGLTIDIANVPDEILDMPVRPPGSPSPIPRRPEADNHDLR